MDFDTRCPRQFLPCPMCDIAVPTDQHESFQYVLSSHTCILEKCTRNYRVFIIEKSKKKMHLVDIDSNFLVILSSESFSFRNNLVNLIITRLNLSLLVS